MRSVFGAAVDDLRRLLHEQGKDQLFDLFRRYDLERSPGGEPVFFNDNVTAAYPGTRCGWTLRRIQAAKALFCSRSVSIAGVRASWVR